MEQETISRLYASLQSLEKCLEHSKRMLVEQKSQPSLVWESLYQQERVLKHMRRVMNILQLESAKQNWNNVSRQIRIFTGLQAMVRPEIMHAFSALSNRELVFQLSEPQVLCN